MSDSMIQTIAVAGNLEAMLSEPGTSNIYILRYSEAEWLSFSSVGWANTQYDSKDSGGSWNNNVCNGHSQNLGFSSYNESGSQICSVLYSGTSTYYTTNHVNPNHTPTFNELGIYLR